MCVPRGALAQVVGGDEIRADDRNRNPEYFDFVVFGKVLDLDQLAVCQLLLRPSQRIGTAVLALAATVVELAIVLQGAVVDLAERLDEQHQILGDVPAIDQHAVEGDGLGSHQGDQHVVHMVQLALTVSIGVVQAVVHDPVLPAVRIDVQTVHHAGALDQAMCIATVLASHQLDIVRVVLVQNRIVKDDAAAWRRDDIALNVFPDHGSCQLVFTQVAIDRIAAEATRMLCIMCDCEVGVRGEKKLAII